MIDALQFILACVGAATLVGLVVLIVGAYRMPNDLDQRW
jgi:hypothetical protein